MDEFERNLRAALDGREPPKDFADRVVSRARAADRVRRATWTRWAVAALVTVLVGGGVALELRRRDELRRKEQILVGLQIMGSKLQRVHARLEAIQQRTLDFTIPQENEQ